MSVLEKFLILFESDADKADKDVKKLDKSLNDTEKSAKSATSATSGASKQFVSMGVKALGAVGGLIALTSAVGGLVSAAERIDELGKFADMIGENIEDIDAWGGAAVRAGGTVDGLRNSIQTLTKHMTDISVKGTSLILPYFEEMGISVTDTNGKIKSTIDIMMELADEFSQVSKQKALGMGRKLGLDRGTIMLLQSGRDAIDQVIERQKKLGVVNKEAAAISADFNDIMADFKQVLDFTAQTLLINFAPAATWAIDKLINLSLWARENKPIVIGFFVGLAAAAVPALVSIAAAGWAAIAPFLIAAAPFIAIGAAAAAAGVAIALVIEDIYMYVNGHESLLGKIVEKWPFVGEVIKHVADGVKNFVELIKTYVKFMWDFNKSLIDIFMHPEKALQSIIDTLSYLNEMISKFTGETFEKLSNMAGEVKTFFSFGGDENEDDKKGFGSSVKSFFGFGDDEVNKNIATGQNTLAFAAASPLAAQTSNSIQNHNKPVSKNTSVQIGEVNVQTQATDSQGIADTVGGSLEKEMRTTVDNFDDGIEI